MAQNLVLPVKCEECGAAFDLWYDLQLQEQMRKTAIAQGRAFVSSEKGVTEALKHQKLCWECRKNLGERNVNLEYELSIEFD